MKSFILWTLAGLLLMLGLPRLGNFSMAVAFLAFYAVNPVFSILCGVAASRNVKQLWVLPLLTGVLFLVGCGLWYTLEEIQFWYYSGIYIALGLAAMGIGSVIRHK